MEAAGKEYSGKTIIYIFFAAALGLRLWNLGGQSFWADEAITIGMYKSPPAGISYFRKFLWDVHGPLYSMLMHFWSMASSSETWLRLPSAIMGSLTVPLTYVWIKKAADERTALLGSLFIALNPFSLYYSQELRFYSMVCLFSILSLIRYHVFIDRPTARNALILGIVLGLTCLSHFSALLLCFGLFVHAVATGRPVSERLGKLLIAGCVLLVIISPWIYREVIFIKGINIENISEMAPEDRLRGELTLSVWSYPYVIYAFSAGYSFGPGLRELHFIRSGMELIENHSFELFSVAIVFGVLLINAFLRKKYRNFVALILTVTVTAALGLTLITLFNVKVFNVRYLMPVFPLFIALLAVGIPERPLSAVVSVLAVSLIMIISDVNYHSEERYARDDIRGAVSIVEEREKRGDAVILQGLAATFDFYYSGDNIDNILFINEAEDPAGRRVVDIIAENDRIWSVRARGYEETFDDKAFTVLSNRMELAESWKLPGVAVYLFKDRTFK